MDYHYLADPDITKGSPADDVIGDWLRDNLTVPTHDFKWAGFMPAFLAYADPTTSPHGASAFGEDVGTSTAGASAGTTEVTEGVRAVPVAAPGWPCEFRHMGWLPTLPSGRH